MDEIEQEEIREYGDYGLLEAAGYRWGEFQHTRNMFGNWLIALSIIVLPIGLLFAIYKQIIATGVVILIHAFSVGGSYLLKSQRWHVRGVLFLRNGRIRTPAGIPNGGEDVDLWKNPWSLVSSIEAYRGQVAIYFSNGDCYNVTQLLEPAVAYKVSIQLTIALQEMRQAVAEFNARANSPAKKRID